MEWFAALLQDSTTVAHTMLVYAFIVAAGIILGRIRIAGVALGVTCVLFIALIAGHAGASVPLPILDFVREFGLILFVYFIGLEVGPSFFSAFKSEGLLFNVLALGCVLLSIVVTLILAAVMSDTVSLPVMLGVHYGAVTNTPGLGATREVLQALQYSGENIAIPYACAYPFGVIGLIAVIVALRKIFHIDVEKEDQLWMEAEKLSQETPVVFHVKITNSQFNDARITDARHAIACPFICSRLMHRGAISSPDGMALLYLGDVVRIVAERRYKKRIVDGLGVELRQVHLEHEHSPLIMRKITVSRLNCNGKQISDLRLSKYDNVNITRVFRAGMELYPYSNMVLRIGDRVACVGPKRAVARLAVHLGDCAEDLNKPNMVTIFLGITLGILLGSVPMHFPGLPVPVKLGLAGGPLIMGLLIGRFGARFNLNGYTTDSASMMLREIGIALFMASVGLAAGDGFFMALKSGEGFLYMGLGLFITVIPAAIIGFIARQYFHINFHSIVGMLAGGTTDAPSLAYASSLSETNSCAVAYSTVYPLTMFLRILTGQLVLVGAFALVN